MKSIIISIAAFLGLAVLVGCGGFAPYVPDLSGSTTGSIVVLDPVTARFTDRVVLDKYVEYYPGRGPSSTNTVTVNLPTGYVAETVNLSFVGLPTGVTGTFTPNPVVLTPGVATVIEASLSVVPGAVDPAVGDYPAKVKIDRATGPDLELLFTLTIIDGEECMDVSVEHNTIVYFNYYGGDAHSEAYLLLNGGPDAGATVSVEGLPQWIQVQIDPANLTLVAGNWSDGVHITYSNSSVTRRKSQTRLEDYEDFACNLVISRDGCDPARVPFTFRVDYYGDN